MASIFMYQSEPIAIIGMGHRFPGDANHPSAFWRLLIEGKDAVCQVAPMRRRSEKPNSQDAYDTRGDKPYWGGFIQGKDPDDFDAAFFRIPPHEAAWLDPQHCWLMETTWEALEDACIPPSSLEGRRIGAYVGICGSDHQGEQLWNRNPEEFSLYSGTGAAFSTSVGRLAYYFGWEGPSLAIDTACSSSLAALHYACQGLLTDDCELALAAGVNGLFSQIPYAALDRLGILSAQGRSRAFDASADGYVRGEGCGVVILKRLSDAKRDGDRIHAVIRSTAVNQDGRSSSFTAPNPRAQVKLLRDALRKARIAPEDVDYIETHGTGTPLGDVVEAEALGEVFSQSRDADHPLWIGSVKTNIGHLEAAAGVAGLIKTVLALQHEMIPKHLHLEQPNPRIPWEQLSIRIASQPIPWPRGERPRRAGISSFGFSGTNAHVIVEESDRRPVAGSRKNGVCKSERLSHILPLSARSDEALRDLARRYMKFLAETNESITDICYSASIGRDHFAHRAAFIGITVEGIREALQRYIDGNSQDDRFTFYRREGVEPNIDMATRYENGENIAWRDIYSSAKRNKISLPLYPFQGKRHVIGTSPQRESICVAPMAVQNGCIHARLASAPENSRRTLLTDFVYITASQIVGEQTTTRLKEDAPLVEQGFDSLLAVELRGALSESLNLQLPVTLLFNYPTIEAIAVYLLGEMSFDPQPHVSSGRNGASRLSTENIDMADSEDAELDALSMEELENLIENDLEKF